MKPRDDPTTAVLTKNCLLPLILMDAVAPPVVQVADALEISRTTGYRYLPHQRALILAAIPAADRAKRPAVGCAAALLGDDDVIGRDVAIGPQSMQPFPGIGRLPVLLVERPIFI
jgi:hypothetical protein